MAPAVCQHLRQLCGSEAKRGSGILRTAKEKITERSGAECGVSRAAVCGKGGGLTAGKRFFTHRHFTGQYTDAFRAGAHREYHRAVGDVHSLLTETGGHRLLGAEEDLTGQNGNGKMRRRRLIDDERGIFPQNQIAVAKGNGYLCAFVA